MPSMIRRNDCYNVVIFDLGNVVLNWNPDQVLESLNLEKKEAELLRDELFFHQDWQDMDHGKLSESTALDRVCERSKLDRTIVDKAFSASKSSLNPIEESVELMREFFDRGIKLYCLSNMSRETYAHIRHYELFTLFSEIVISGIEGCRKPDEAIFHLMLDRFGLDPSEAFFIDDTLPNVETARKLGIHAYHFKRSKTCYADIRKSVLG